MTAGDSLRTTKPIRSQKSGVMLPRDGTYVRTVENLGRQLILVDFGSAGEEYLFPDEIIPAARRLSITRREINKRALRFYRKYGFRLAGGASLDGPDDSVLLKEIGPERNS